MLILQFQSLESSIIPLILNRLLPTSLQVWTILLSPFYRWGGTEPSLRTSKAQHFPSIISTTSVVQSAFTWAVWLWVAHVNIFRQWHGHHWSLGADCELLGAQWIRLPGFFANMLGQSSLRAGLLSCAINSAFQADASFPSSDLSLLGSGVLLFGHVSLYTQKPPVHCPQQYL